MYDEMVHSFGNLTLSGYNSKLSNQSFEKKQSKAEANIFGNKIYIGYKNGLALNNIRFKVGEEITSLSETKNGQGNISSLVMMKWIIIAGNSVDYSNTPEEELAAAIARKITSFNPDTFETSNKQNKLKAD